jgi:signal transduction histidine kinase
VNTHVEALYEPARARRVPSRRAILIAGFVVLLVALVGGLAVVVLHFQSESRGQARQRFQQQSVLTAEFTGSLLTSSAATAEAGAAKAFGGSIDPSALNAAAKKAGLSYLVILDAHGQRLGASAGAPADAAAPGSSHVQHALAGHAWFSDLVGTGERSAIEWAQPFEAPSGRRVQIEGFPIGVLGAFLNTFLAKSQPSDTTVAFLVDGNQRIIAASSQAAAIGERPQSPGLASQLRTREGGSYRTTAGVRRYFASAPVDGSNWRAATATDADALYPALAGSQSWILYLILATFAAVSATSAFFFRRALMQGDAAHRANIELTAVNATLEKRVAERTAAAEERARELARSNEELEQFSSVASHDLQEPLRKIRMFGDRLQSRLGEGISADAASDLERMRNAAERMQQLINDLLEFSRVTYRGNSFEPVALSTVATEVVADLEARIAELDAVVEVGELPTIDADRTQMRQLLQNLMSNALKFHKAEERPVVRVRAETFPARPPRFDGESAALARCVITVEDNGIGFDAKHAERIFGAFERLHGRSAYEGTGIGLSIARKIAWRHGGHIDASGTPGVGATFTVTLPISHDPSRNGGPAT